MSTESSSPETHDNPTRERLLRSARALFLERGYTSTSVKDIVEAAGVTKPVLYYYFENKEAVYIAIIREAHEGLQRTLSAFEAESRSLDPETQVLRTVEAVFTYFMQEIDSGKLILRETIGAAKGVPIYQRANCLEAFEGTFLRIIQSGIEQGIWAGNPRIMLGVVQGLLDSAIIAEVRSDRLWQPGLAGLQEMLRTAICGFRASAPKSPPSTLHT